MASPSTGDRLKLLAAACGGAIFAATSPPSDFTLGVFLGLALFAWSLLGAETKRTAFLRGFFFGAAANLVALRFVPSVIVRFTPLPYVAGVAALVLLALAQALPWALGGLVHRVTEKRGAPAWLAFAASVYVATFVPCVFPWTPAGGLATWPAMLQLADVIGERGVSFVV
ncbi:MAG TPA: apolipoprotein N-acyltransferase, partial [Labilithrix sp.]